MPQSDLSQTPEFDSIVPHKSGTYGDVWKATQTRFPRHVALKKINEMFCHQTTALIHARSLANLSHPNIVTVYDVANVKIPGDELPSEVVVMEWIEGESLSDAIQKGGIDRELVMEIMESIVSAIEYMHKHNATHCDLNVGNILIRDDGLIKIIDPSVNGANSMAKYSTATLEDRKIQDIGWVKMTLEYCTNRCPYRFPNLDLVLDELSRARAATDLKVIVAKLRADKLPPPSPSAPTFERKMQTTLKTIGDWAINQEDYSDPFNCSDITLECRKQGLSDSDAWDAIIALCEEGLLKSCSHRFARKGSLAMVGFNKYLECNFPPFERKFKITCLTIMEGKLSYDWELAAIHQYPLAVAKLFLRILQKENMCSIRDFGTRLQVIEFSRRLRDRFPN
jgi:serine/threonine protein kinase